MGVGLVRSLQPSDILWIHWRVYDCIANTSKRVLFLPPFWCLCQKPSLSPLYFNKTLSHKPLSVPASSLDPDRILLLQRPRTPSSLRDSATIFHLGGSSGILQDKVRMLGALVPCSPREHASCCTLLTLQCACVNEWHALPKASEEPWSVIPR